MPGLSFIHTLMLAGLTALVIPVLIHLLLKRKTTRLRFSTVQFFAPQDEQSSRRRRLRHWLLLSLRLLIVALLVLAFARPYLPQGRASDAARQRRQVVLVVDRSASMQAVGTDGPRWTRAKERMQSVIAGLRPEDRVALVGCSRRAEVLSGFAPPVALAKQVSDLQPTYDTSNLGEGLQQAVRLLSASDLKARSTIYLVSDLQRSACEHLASVPVPRQVEIDLLAVGALFAPNLALTRLQVEARNDTSPQVSAASFSDEANPHVPLDFSLDGTVAFSRSVGLEAGAATNVEFALPALKPGWHDLKAALRTQDALEADNFRYAAFYVPEPVQALVVEPRTTSRVFEEASFFLTAALDPTKDSTDRVAGAYRLVQTTPEALRSQLSGRRGQRPYDVVIMPGMKQIPPGSGEALTAFVQAGGGLLLFLGEGVSANHYKSELRNLLPAQLGEPEVSTEAGAGWRMGEVDAKTAVFAAFRLPHSGDLHIPEFSKRYRLTPVAAASPLALFDDGLPLLLTRPVGQGRVALVNTSADTSWNDWPKHKTFVPWLHGLGSYLARKTGPDPLQATNTFAVGEDCDLEMGAGAGHVQFRLQTPSGQAMLLTADDQGRLRDLAFALPGVYSLRDRSGRELRRLAVNVPPQESDLAALRPAEFQQQLARVPEPPKTTLLAGLSGSANARREFWAVVLLGVLALLLLETLVANRTLA